MLTTLNNVGSKKLFNAMFNMLIVFSCVNPRNLKISSETSCRTNEKAPGFETKKACANESDVFTKLFFSSRVSSYLLGFG